MDKRRGAGVRAYYDRLTAGSIGDLARELLPDGTKDEGGGRLGCDCPNHASESHTSLKVDPARGVWFCHACRVGGDALQLVEFVHHGCVTAGRRGPMPASHRTARDWLADRAGLPPLGRSGVEDVSEEEAEQASADMESAFSALGALIEVYHQDLLERPEVLVWVEAQWGFGRATVERFRLGFAIPGDDPIPRAVGGEVEPGHLISSGAIWPGRERGDTVPFFDGRLVFPYWSRGRVVYAIGRETPWTVEAQRGAKYKKLPVRSERHSHVSPWISNSVLFGEDCLLGRPDRVLITEGVTDAIAALELGIPTVSPATVRLKPADLDRVVRSLGGVTRVIVLQDEEVSGVGLEGALETGRAMAAAGVDCGIATLPLGEPELAARRELDELAGEGTLAALEAVNPNQRARFLEGRVAEELREEVRTVLGACKLDLCGWTLAGGSREALEEILDAGRAPVEVAVDSAPTSGDKPPDRVAACEALLADVGGRKPTERDELLKRLAARISVSVGLLRQEANRAAKEARARKPRPVSEVPEDADLSELVAARVADARTSKVPADWEEIAREAFEWFLRMGGRFFRDPEGRPSMFFEDEVWDMAGGDPGPRHRFLGLMFRLTGLVPTSTGPKTFFAALSALAADRGEVRESFPCFVEDVLRPAVWLTSNAETHAIYRCDSTGVHVLQNGSNDDLVVLRGDPKFRPFVFDEDARAADLDGLLWDLIGRHLACERGHAVILLDWLCCFPLLGFAGTRPMVRLEGAAGSGKTWAAKLLTTLLYGAEAQKRATDAANYADAARNPLVALDNVETKNATEGLIDFMLCAVTGITREKRSRGSDSAVVGERPRCLILSTGIEPLAGDLEEVMSRSLVVEFHAERQAEYILEKRILAELASRRDLVLSCVLRRTAQVLWLVHKLNGQELAQRAIRRTLKRHDKSRCDDFLSLMYLHRVAAAAEELRESMLEDLDPGFADAVSRLNETSRAISRDASPIVASLLATFVQLRESTDGLGLDVRGDARDRIEGTTAASLFVALKKVARERGMPAPWTNAAQFGRRFQEALPSLREQGFQVSSWRNRNRAWCYDLSFTGRTGALSTDRPDDGRPADLLQGQNTPEGACERTRPDGAPPF